MDKEEKIIELLSDIKKELHHANQISKSKEPNIKQMFHIDPNTIYTINALTEITGYGKSTVYAWFRDGLKHHKAAGGKATTGRALLNYFERTVNETTENEEQELPPKVVMRLHKAGAL